MNGIAILVLSFAVFLKKTKRRGWMLYLPMTAMLVLTFCALGLTIRSLLGKLSDGTFIAASDGLRLVFAALLLGLGFVAAFSGIKQIRRSA